MKNVVFEIKNFSYKEKLVPDFKLSVGETALIFSPIIDLNTWFENNQFIFVHGKFSLISNIFNHNESIRELTILILDYGSKNPEILNEIYTLLPFLKDYNSAVFDIFECVAINILVNFFKYDLVVFYTNGLAEITKYKIIKTVLGLTNMFGDKSSIVIEIGGETQKINEFKLFTIKDSTIIEDNYRLSVTENKSNWKLKK